MSMTTLNTVRTYRQDRTRTLEARTESRYRKQVRRDKYGK